jgi:Spy/CpxP family protein refolding chaperone
MQYRRLAGVMLVACVACGWVWSQEAAKPDAQPAAAQQSSEKLTGRLPNYYGQVGLSEAQRQKIYGLQAQYGDQIDALVKKVEELRQKRDKEIEDVLSAEQKAKLKALMEAAAAKKKTSKKAAPE